VFSFVSHQAGVGVTAQLSATWTLHAVSGNTKTTEDERFHICSSSDVIYSKHVKTQARNLRVVRVKLKSVKVGTEVT